MFNKTLLYNTISPEEKERFKQAGNIYYATTALEPETQQITWWLTNAWTQRKNGYDQLYQTITGILQGSVWSEEVKAMFPVHTGNTEAISIMNQKAAIFEINNLNIELLQTSLNDNDVQRQESFVSIFSRVLNETYLKQPEIKYAISEAIKYSRGYPMSVTLIGYDDNAVIGSSTNVKGNITLENIPINNFYWDPSSNTIDQCEYVFITKILDYHTLKNFLEKLKDGHPDLFSYQYFGLSNTSMTEGSSEIKNNQELVNQGSIEIKVLYKKIIEDSKTKVKVYYLVGYGQSAVIVGTQVLDIPYLPFAILKEHSAPDSFTGISSVMLALPHIKHKYFLDGVMNNIALLAKNPSYVVTQSSLIDGSQLIDWGDSEAGKAFKTMDAQATQSIALVPTPSIQNDMLAYSQLIDQRIQKAINATDAINFNSKLSGAAVQNAINQSTIQENTSISELESYIVRVVRIMLKLFQLKIPELNAENPLLFRAKNKNPNANALDSENELIQITADEFIQLEADVVIDASLLRSTKIEQQRQDMLALYQLELQYNKGETNGVTIEDIAKTLVLPNKQEMIERIKQNTIQQQQQDDISLVQGVLNLLQQAQDPDNPEAEQLQQMGLDQITAMVAASIKQNKQGGNNG